MDMRRTAAASPLNSNRLGQLERFVAAMGITFLPLLGKLRERSAIILCEHNGATIAEVFGVKVSAEDAAHPADTAFVSPMAVVEYLVAAANALPDLLARVRELEELTNLSVAAARSTGAAEASTHALVSAYLASLVEAETRKGVPLAEIARVTGLAGPHLSMLRSQRRIVGLKTVAALAAYFKKSVADILAEAGASSRSP